MIEKNVTDYQVVIYGGPKPFNSTRALVRLFQNEGIVGNIHFVDLGEALKDNEESGGSITMWLPLTELSNVVDVLRNESPVKIGFEKDAAYLLTDREKVGEAE